MKKISKIILVATVVIVIVFGINIFNFLTDDSDYSIITYKGIKYECVSNDISITTMKYENLWQDSITKIGTYEGADVYEIQDIDNQDFLYFDYPAMIGNAPMGIYKKADIEIDFTKDSDITWFGIYHYNGEENRVEDFTTKDKEIIDNVIKLFNNPIENTNHNAMQPNEKYYNAYFSSKKYPMLIYNFYYVEDADGNYYLKTDTNIYKIDDYISNLLENFTHSNHLSGYVDKIENDIIYIDSGKNMDILE